MDRQTPEDAEGPRPADAEGSGDEPSVQDPEESGSAVAVVSALAAPPLTSLMHGVCVFATGRHHACQSGSYVGVAVDGAQEFPSVVIPISWHGGG